ncbi:MAG: 2,3-diaminopropionate biosynthesis protein SbnA [Cyclobacteriaceae bacterium]
MQRSGQQPFANILETIGQTPLISLPRLFPMSNIQLYGKLEAANPGGSIKDRTAARILVHALRQGDLKPGQTVIESSSGNMAIGLAQACMFYGLKLIVVVDPLINSHTLKILKTYGAEINQVDAPHADGGYLNARLERVQELLDQIPGSFWSNQYANRQNPLTHRQTMKEIAEALDGQLDYLFAATSTCGTLMGCAEYVKDQGLDTKIIAVDAIGSAIFGMPPQTRKIPGHGAGRPSNFLKRELVHEVIHVSDTECVSGCRRLLQSEAILCGGSSGAIVSAVEKYHPHMPEGATCAIILCDRGERYLDTIYNDQWVEEHQLNEVLSI